MLGLSESLTSLYIGNEWALIVDFVLFLLVLSFKPSGLFGDSAHELFEKLEVLGVSGRRAGVGSHAMVHPE